MQHFSCDLCGKDLTAEYQARYVLKMEAFAPADPYQLSDDDLDMDPIEDTAHFLGEMAGTEPTEDRPLLPTRQSLRFDLCPSCYRKFTADPLGRETATKFDFSKN